MENVLSYSCNKSYLASENHLDKQSCKETAALFTQLSCGFKKKHFWVIIEA